MRRIIIQSLAALALGILVAGIVFGSTVLSDDIRLIVLLGTVGLLLCGVLAAAKIDRGLLVGALLCLPVFGLFAFFVLQQLPFLWPTFLIWPTAATIGLFFFSARPRLIVSGMIALLIFSGWYCAAYIPNQMQRALSHVGSDSAPAFQFDPVSEGNVPRTATRGKILVIDFFATWCRPCIDELPELRAIHDELQDRHDIEFVVVGTTAGGDTPEKLREFAKRRAIGLPLAFDPGKKAHRSFGLSGFPSLVVIDRTGQTRFRHEGYNPSEVNFRRSVVQLLRNL